MLYGVSCFRFLKILIFPEEMRSIAATESFIRLMILDTYRCYRDRLLNISKISNIS